MIVTPLVLAVMLSATPAVAPEVSPANVAKARDAFQYAQKLYKQARYAEAIAKFEEAYTLRPHPVIYFNIGRCYEQLNETAKALRAYKDYLRLDPDAKDRETVTDAMANLERRLKEKGLQQLLVYAEPANSRIEVDGKELGNSPASVELSAGNHRLQVKAEGFEQVDRSFVVSLARSMEMTITLRPSTPAVPVPVVAAAEPKPVVAADAPKKEAAPALTPATTATTDLVKEPEPAPRKRVFTWVAGGTAIAAAGAGIGMGLAASAASDELRRSEHDQLTAQRLHDTAGDMSLGANVGYGVAAVAGVTAVVLFFVEGR